MDGITGPSRLGEFASAHPEVSICQVEGVWRAEMPIGDNGGGALFYGRTEDELLTKLDDAAKW